MRPLRRPSLVLIVIAAAAAALWGFRAWRTRAPGDQPRAVVLLTIDTLRADRLTGQTMPALERLASGGLRFDHARTPVPLTLPAHTSLMTGLLPPAHGVRLNGARAAAQPSIARVLRDAGFRTGAFVSAFVLDRQFGLADGFEQYDDRVARDPDAALRLEAERPGDETIAAALAWLATIDASRDRFFLWVHLFEPHAPYAPSRNCGASPEADGDAGPGAYDRDVACADALAGRLIGAVNRAAGANAADIAWIVAGDHGEGLGEHGESTHGMLAYDATLRVPLVLRGPGIRASVSSAPVSLIDVAPTLLTWLGVARPPSMPGLDLRAAPAADRDVYSETLYPRMAGWHGVSALSGARWKAIRTSGIELYDLQADPGETTDVAAAHRPIAEAMGGAAAREGESAGPRTAAGPPAEAVERLRALGYVGGGAPAARDEQGAGNPALEIASWGRFEHALSLLNTGRARDALVTLQTLATSHPGARVFASSHARALQETGAVQAALDVRRAIAARWPDDAMVFHDLASAARAAGKAEEAAKAEQAALALDPGNAAAFNGLGLLHADAGRDADAAAAFAKAAAADPGNASYWTNLGNAERARGDLAAAERAYRRALAQAPAFADGLNGLGVLLVQSGRARDAVPLFERALASDPDLIESRLNLGIACQESGRLAEAADAYRMVIQSAKPGSREHSAATALLAALK